MTEILMKGVELPKGEDVIELTIDSDGCIIFYDGHGEIEQYVEVIKPHGRLIDADKLTSAILSCMDAEKEYSKKDFGLVKMVIYHIVKAHTVLEAST